jgi:hypothetical protein
MNTYFQKIEKEKLLYTLWIVVMLGVINADVLSLFVPSIMDDLAQTSAATGVSIPNLMAFGAAMGVLGLAMIPLSRFLERTSNRRLNLFMSPLYILYIIAGAAGYPHYWILASMEIACLSIIFVTAWRWKF